MENSSTRRSTIHNNKDSVNLGFALQSRKTERTKTRRHIADGVLANAAVFADDGIAGL